MHGDTIVFFHAHPDDEAIFTGLTMRRLADAGARVVLATATTGDLGAPLVPLARGETLARRRHRELELASAELGVARLVQLGYRDSGMPGWVDNGHPNALAMANRRGLARWLANLCAEEGAAALVHYDSHGIYGHPDHVAVHLVGRLAARLAQITAYEATVDREHLHIAHQTAEGDHLVHGANSSQPTPYGRVTVEIPLAVAADEATLAAKRRAMAAHASQIPPHSLDLAGFSDVYGLEWYLRDGPAGVVDRLGNVHAIV
jgi:N-acetyl-1-D-myo-inositol-2-amino-2-deoxy-alpha-D-glucopyranoside deacetylase